jgi:hypothetical protein
MSYEKFSDSKHLMYLSAAQHLTSETVNAFDLTASYSEEEIAADAVSNCKGTAGTLGSLGTACGCAGTFGTAGTYGCGA